MWHRLKALRQKRLKLKETEVSCRASHQTASGTLLTWWMLIEHSLCQPKTPCIWRGQLEQSGLHRLSRVLLCSTERARRRDIRVMKDQQRRMIFLCFREVQLLVYTKYNSLDALYQLSSSNHQLSMWKATQMCRRLNGLHERVSICKWNFSGWGSHAGNTRHIIMKQMRYVISNSTQWLRQFEFGEKLMRRLKNRWNECIFMFCCTVSTSRKCYHSLQRTFPEIWNRTDEAAWSKSAGIVDFAWWNPLTGSKISYMKTF